jgi:MFS family permease
MTTITSVPDRDTPGEQNCASSSTIRSDGKWLAFCALISPLACADCNFIPVIGNPVGRSMTCSSFFSGFATLHYTTAVLIHLSFFSAYVVACFPASIYIRRYGYRNMLLSALILMAAGTAVCVPALALYSFRFCLIGIFYARHRHRHTANGCLSIRKSAYSARKRGDKAPFADAVF